MEIQVEVLCNKYANTYLVGTKNEMIIVDPAVDVRTIMQMQKKYFSESVLKGIVLTHGHYDHFIYLNDVLKEYNVLVFAGLEEIKKLDSLELSCANLFGITRLEKLDAKFMPVHHLTKVDFSTFSLKFYKTSGHTNGSICLEIGNYLFTGDTLFQNGVGRTDLPTGNSSSLKESIAFLTKLSKNYLVYPGHGDSTTLDEERSIIKKI